MLKFFTLVSSFDAKEQQQIQQWPLGIDGSRCRNLVGDVGRVDRQCALDVQLLLVRYRLVRTRSLR